MSRMLLERLRWPPRGGTTSIRPNPEDPVEVRESIRRNLERLLNSRQGMAKACPDYGLPDTVELISQLPEGQWEIEKAIQTTIEKYEPRLRKKSVRVQYFESPERAMRACFHITAAIETRDGSRSVKFETEVGFGRVDSPKGQVKVQ